MSFADILSCLADPILRFWACLSYFFSSIFKTRKDPERPVATLSTVCEGSVYGYSTPKKIETRDLSRMWGPNSHDTSTQGNVSPCNPDNRAIKGTISQAFIKKEIHGLENKHTCPEPSSIISLPRTSGASSNFPPDSPASSSSSSPSSRSVQLSPPSLVSSFYRAPSTPSSGSSICCTPPLSVPNTQPSPKSYPSPRLGALAQRRGFKGSPILTGAFESKATSSPRSASGSPGTAISFRSKFSGLFVPSCPPDSSSPPLIEIVQHNHWDANPFSKEGGSYLAPESPPAGCGREAPPSAYDLSAYGDIFGVQGVCYYGTLRTYPRAGAQIAYQGRRNDVRL